MAEYINKKDLIDFIKDTRQRLPHDSKDFFTRDNMLLNFEQIVSQMPTADVAEVRRGKWVEVVGMAPPELHGLHFCSICKEFALQKRHKECLSDYCPNCGAKMGDDE